MSRTSVSLAVLTCVGALVSTSALCQDLARNPLLKPVVAKASTAPAAGHGLPPAPALDDLLPPVRTTFMGADQVAGHLAMLRVVATVGNKAILRGPIGKTGNLALSATSPPADAGSAGGPAPIGQAAAAPAAGPLEDKYAAIRSITVTNGEPIQLAGGIWVRPEISGASVRLFLQSSSNQRSESLIYASAVEIGDTQAAPLPERQFDSKAKPAK